MTCDLETPIPDWIIEHPQTTRIFAELQFDVCCGGKSLEYVCHQHGLSPAIVLQKLRDAISTEDYAN